MYLFFGYCAFGLIDHLRRYLPSILCFGRVVIGQSGVTIGRGLDLGNPPTGATGQSPAKLDLKALFQEAELIPELSDWLLSVEGVKRASALESLDSSGLTDDELTITRKQQHLMFNDVYDYMEEKTRILLTKSDVKKAYGDVGWDDLPSKVKDILIDLTYRGDNHGYSRKIFVPALVLDKDLNDYSNFYNALEELVNIPPERLKLRLKWLN